MSISLCYLEDEECRIAFEVLCREIGYKNDRLEKDLEKVNSELACANKKNQDMSAQIQAKDTLLMHKEEQIQELTEEVSELEDEVRLLNEDIDEFEDQRRRDRHRWLLEQHYRRYCRELGRFIQRKLEPAMDLTYLSNTLRAHFNEDGNLEDAELDINMRFQL